MSAFDVAPWDQVQKMLDTFDGSMRLESASVTCWSAELRLMLTDPELAPARSMMFYAVGCAYPEEAAWRVLEDAKAWMDESGVEPLPVPEWMHGEVA